MAAPPPQDDDSGPEAIAFGIAAVDEVLEEADLTFPADRKALEATVGDREIPYDSRGRSVRLSAVLAETEKTTFESRRELLNALHPIFEEKRDRGGVGGWLRAFFPF